MSATYYSRIPQLKGEARARASEIVGKTAQDMRSTLRETTPVDLGYLVSTLYLRRNGYAWARIGYSANYAIFVEKGTRGRPGQNFLGRAFVLHTRNMRQAFKELIG